MKSDFDSKKLTPYDLHASQVIIEKACLTVSGRPAFILPCLALIMNGGGWAVIWVEIPNTPEKIGHISHQHQMI